MRLVRINVVASMCAQKIKSIFFRIFYLAYLSNDDSFPLYLIHCFLTV